MHLAALFEDKLQADFTSESLIETETFWDQKADGFYYNQVHGSVHFAQAVPDLLEQKGIINSRQHVLDIGAGSGRYAVPLAQRCAQLTALDISQNMLGLLNKEVDKYHLNNVQSLQSSWPTTHTIKSVDVAFSAMCPATRSIKALQAMSDIAHTYAVICQFTASTDSMVENLKAKKLITEHIGPANNRDLLQAYFNIVWELGYQPEIAYLYDTFQQAMTMTDAFEHYRKRYEKLSEQDLHDILQAEADEKGQIIVTKQTTLAVLSWSTT